VSNAAEPNSVARDILIIALAILASFGLLGLIWLGIDRYEGNAVFEGILALVAVGANVYAVVMVIRLLWLFFRRRQ
jgi:apolipoprotein N-acyltransferase